MTRVLIDVRARMARWWIQRNPTYLLSAACMAVGTKLYLDAPTSRAGDVGLILLTLGALQLYEWGVAAILIALHRARRAPEDQPSLLLLAALFWTGPMAATLEMTARRPSLGLITALCACLIAWMEMAVVCRHLALRMRPAGRLIAAACVLLLAVAPRQLAVPARVDGNNELLLYAAWWTFGALALGLIWVVRSHVGRGPLFAWGLRQSRDFTLEAAFQCIVFAATAAHLVAMNYAFFTHARFFYAAPLMAAMTAVAFECLARFPSRRGVPLVVCTAGPLLMVAASFERFDPSVAVAWLPAPLRDPVSTALLLGVAAWWFGAIRHRRVSLFHIGAVALAWSCWRLRGAAASVSELHELAASPWPSRGAIAVGCYAVAVYLLMVAVVRRSRVEAMLAAIIHLAGFATCIWGFTPQWPLHLALVAGWTGLASSRLLSRQTRVVLAFLSILVLLSATFLAEFHAPFAFHARLHACAMPVALLALAFIARDPRSRRAAMVVISTEALFYLGRWIAIGPHAAPTLAMLGGFALLALGAFVSWNKSRWTPPDAVPPPDEPLMTNAP